MANLVVTVKDIYEFNGTMQVSTKIVTDTSTSFDKDFAIPVGILDNTPTQLNTALRNAVNAYMITQGFILNAGEAIVIVGGVV